MKAVERRRIMTKAQDRGIEIIKNAAYAALQAQWRSLYARLRKLRKVDIEDDDEYWQEQADIFEGKLNSALVEAMKDVNIANAKFYGAVGIPLDPIDPQVVLQAYRARVAERIGMGPDDLDAVTETTRQQVSDAIVEWYGTDQGLDVLVSRIMQENFSQYRAEMIAQTEMTGITSQIQLETFRQIGEDSWYWINVNDNLVCNECLSKHGILFSIDDEMPPAHPNCRCFPSGAKYIRLDLMPAQLRQAQGE